ncbi:hypothetical protein B9N62_02790 [Campylobacter concisus]|uniref:Uncharacterized protein n=1 Tax=Campylobacter concisus TaxID=199 RepID=A0A1Y5N1U3_9BACT|nr:hypothetical protein [Campylobacter concisus]OUT11862.1 hypothetical protein B9N62_02790 [Campylobacter concisus]
MSSYDIDSMYVVSFIFFSIVLPIFLIIPAGRYNIKVYASKFDLIGLHLIFPIIILPALVGTFILVCNFLNISDYAGLSFVFYAFLILMISYIIYGFYVCIRYNYGFFHCIVALFLRFNYVMPLIYLLFLGGKNYKDDKEITSKNIKDLNLFDQFRFSIYNLIAIRN